MRLLKQAVGGLGTLVVVLVIAALVMPKATRAIVSTLVTVVNTATNPATTEDISKAGSQIVELLCEANPGASGAITSCLPQLASGILELTAFTVPAGQTFVITSIDIRPFTPGPGINIIFLAQSNSLGTQVRNPTDGYVVPNTNTTQLQFPTSGIAISSGSTLSLLSAFESAGGVAVTLHGYLTSN